MGKTVIYFLVVQKLLNLKQKILRLLQLHYAKDDPKDERKELLKNTVMFGMESKTKSKK